METSPVWFSRREYEYESQLKEERWVFQWTDRRRIEDWDNCVVSAVSRPNNRVKVVVRRTKSVRSQYRKRDVTIRHMLGFDVSHVEEPEVDEYNEPIPQGPEGMFYVPARPRWVFQLDEDYWIWQWAEQGKQIRDSAVYTIFSMIKRKIEVPDFSGSNTFDLSIEGDAERIIPVVYQPSIDSRKNFVREVHCRLVGTNEYEVTLLFNNEELRRHAVLNRVYEWFRSWFFGRTIDVETFRMVPQETPDVFTFRGIYSGNYGIAEDNVHEDKPDLEGKVPMRKVRYYFVNRRHPVVFVNTSNHAMAEHDNNNRLWKWEYVAWEQNSPVVYGTKSREEINRSFRPRLRLG